ncbi:MAG: hypothetical protein ACHREM_30725, partial [Polyangiales bacterium]
MNRDEVQHSTALRALLDGARGDVLDEAAVARVEAKLAAIGVGAAAGVIAVKGAHGAGMLAKLATVGALKASVAAVVVAATVGIGVHRWRAGSPNP